MNKIVTGIVSELRHPSVCARRFAGIVAAWVALDQLTKYWAIATLTTAFESFGETLGFGARLDRFLWLRHPGSRGAQSVLDNFWHHHYAENPGAAWSFWAGAGSSYRAPLLLAVAAVAMSLMVVYLRKTDVTQVLLQTGLACVFGGALGNFLDRIRLGYVIDFVAWHWYDKAAWPTFNVADVAISVGVGLMLLDMVLHREGRDAASGVAVKGKVKGV